MGCEEACFHINFYRILLMNKFYRKQYHALKDQWCGVPEVFERADIIDVSSVRSLLS